MLHNSIIKKISSDLHGAWGGMQVVEIKDAMPGDDRGPKIGCSIKLVPSPDMSLNMSSFLQEFDVPCKTWKKSQAVSLYDVICMPACLFSFDAKSHPTPQVSDCGCQRGMAQTDHLPKICTSLLQRKGKNWALDASPSVP